MQPSVRQPTANGLLGSSAQDPEADRFRAFARPLALLAALFAAIYLGAGAILGSGALVACGGLAIGLVASCVHGLRAAARSRLSEAALSVGLGLVGIAVTFPFLLPSVYPTLVMMPIAAVALALQYLSGRPLAAMVAIASVASVTAAVAGVTLEGTMTFPRPFEVFVLVATIVIDVGLTMLLLVQFSSRLRATIAELRLREERLRSLSLATNQAVWSTDRDGRVREDSPSWRSLTGQSAEDWLDRGWLDAVHPEDRDAATAAWDDAVATGRPYTVEYRLRGADGRWIETIARGIPVRGEDGAITEWIGTTTDVTEVKRAWRALDEESRRKDEFLAMLGHELRNPLAPIRTAAALLRRRGRADPELAIIERQLGNLTRLVDDLLDVSRVTRGRIALRPETVDVRDLVRAAVDANREEIERRGHALAVELPERPVEVDGDPVRLEQVLWNLVSNAAKYTPPGGRIAVLVTQRGAEASIRVRDDGVGISPEFLPRVFDPFEQDGRTLDRASGGLGLGLAIVRRLVELHGGRVAARSAGEGQGSEFEVVLPVHPVEEARLVSQPAAAPRQGDALDILVIDDNTDAADLHAALLASWGHRATAVHVPEKGLDHVARHRPDVALVDIGLPRIDGYEVARRIRAMPGGDRIRLVAVTGYGHAEDRARALAAGFDEHLAKPVEPERLRAALVVPAPGDRA